MRATYPSFRGRTALVTGGASGIGAAIVAGFARNGAQVAFLDRDEAAGAATAEATGALFVPCDLMDIPALRAAVAHVSATLGPVRALVNNAANDQRHDPDRVEPEDWDFSLNVNLRHHFFAAQAVRGGMR
ncbi:MAG: SDR family oxidoreductase, partial [Rubellimicrobium sp.]|nr:SDR family oxidoreductase [Rubellimicrobium sp.]